MDNLTVDRHLCLFEILYCHKLVDLASEFLFNHWIYIQPGFHSIMIMMASMNIMTILREIDIMPPINIYQNG